MPNHSECRRVEDCAGVLADDAWCGLLRQRSARHQVLAILPDVLRTGSRYEKWRQMITAKATVHSVGCAFQFENSPYLDPATAIVFGYVSSHDRPVGDGPTLCEYHVRNPQGALPKTTVLSETLSREVGRAHPVFSLVIDNERREVARTISRSADFFFGGTPLLHLIYKFLADDLERKYRVKVQ